MPAEPSFDRIACPYRLLERLTFGHALERCRRHFLPDLTGRRRALVLGDGDGRFLAALLRQNPTLQADAVDFSPAMLDLLRARCRFAGPRLRTHQTSALTFKPNSPYDLIATNFFLDCLTQPQLEALAARLAPFLALKGLWLVSEFRIPPGPLALPARLLIRSLYLAFRLLTGLRVTRLPDHTAALQSANLRLAHRHLTLKGLLTTEIWIKIVQPRL